MTEEERQNLIAALANARANPSIQGILRQQQIEGILQTPTVDIPTLSIGGGGSLRNGVLGGGGSINYEFPAGNLASILMMLGGGGAIGNQQTPLGKEKIRDFSHSGGIFYKKNF